MTESSTTNHRRGPLVKRRTWSSHRDYRREDATTSGQNHEKKMLIVGGIESIVDSHSRIECYFTELCRCQRFLKASSLLNALTAE